MQINIGVISKEESSGKWLENVLERKVVIIPYTAHHQNRRSAAHPDTDQNSQRYIHSYYRHAHKVLKLPSDIFQGHNISQKQPHFHKIH